VTGPRRSASHGPSVGALLLLACVALPLGLPACGSEPEPPPPPVAPLAAGDSLLERLGTARVLQYPPSNLAPELQALLGGVVRVQAPVSPLLWERVWAMPAAWEDLLATRGRRQVWWARPPLPLVSLDSVDARPVALVKGVQPALWDPRSTTPVPPGYACWYPPERLLLAVANAPPTDVSLIGSVSAESEFVRFERGEALLGRVPAAEGLRMRTELDDCKRDALLLPAPGVLEFPVDELLAERLHVAVGVPDQSWSLRDGVVQRDGPASDGVVCAVEVLWSEERRVEPAGAPAQVERVERSERVWTYALEQREVGRGWHEAVIDLSRWQGQAVRLRLVSEPGARDKNLHDYVLWADLRLRGGARRAAGRPHVVFIDIDTLRADRLAAYGARRATMPRLDAWADAHATVYTDAVSTAPWTLPSTVSMFTGLAVHQHGVDKAADALGPGSRTLATTLAAAGYETRAITAGGYLRPAYGMDLGFERYETRDPKDLDWSSALDFVADRDSERPFFLFLHSYAVHAPYEYNERYVDPAYDGPLRSVQVDHSTVFEPWMECRIDLSAADDRYLEDLYDGLCARTDLEVGAFLDALEQMLAGEPLLVVFTSDHGEAFQEHGLLGHGISLYEEVLRVPLFVRYPDGRPARSRAPASGVDILPTVLDVVGLPALPGLAGTSLRTGRARDVRVAQSGTDERAVLSEDWKLIEPFDLDEPAANTWVQLYDLVHDRREVFDRSDEEADRLSEMRRRLAWFLEAHPTPQDGGAVETAAGAAELAELKALGYLGG